MTHSQRAATCHTGFKSEENANKLLAAYKILEEADKIDRKQNERAMIVCLAALMRRRCDCSHLIRVSDAI